MHFLELVISVMGLGAAVLILDEHTDIVTWVWAKIFRNPFAQYLWERRCREGK